MRKRGLGKEINKHKYKNIATFIEIGRSFRDLGTTKKKHEKEIISIKSLPKMTETTPRTAMRNE
jgi:hypothetical protein